MKSSRYLAYLTLLLPCLPPTLVKVLANPPLRLQHSSPKAPIASTTDYGLVRLADDQEIDDGSADQAVVMTVADIQQLVRREIDAALADVANSRGQVPIGSVVAWPNELPPENWLILNGQAINPSQYPALAALLPSNSLPDLRGLTIVGAKAGESLLTHNAGSIKGHSHSGTVNSVNLGSKTTGNAGNHDHYLMNYVLVGSGANHGRGGYLSIGGMYSNNADNANNYRLTGSDTLPTKYLSSTNGNHHHSLTLGSHSHSVSINAAGGAENIPAHRKLHWIIRAR